MPEYPEVTVYIERLRHFVQGHALERVRIAHIFLLRTADPPIATLEGRVVCAIERLGKRIVFVFDDAAQSGAAQSGAAAGETGPGAPAPSGDLFLVLHLMISGRLHWQKAGARIPAKRGLGALDFAHGTLLITESSTQKRASLHLVQGRAALAAFDRGGL